LFLRFEISRGFLIDALRWRTEVPYQTEGGKSFEDIVRDIDLPPVKTLPLRSRVPVMIVVPPFAKGDECEKKAILAVIPRLKARLTDHMG
jgi:hypothetical protein